MPIYFSAADRQLEGLSRVDTFERNLLLDFLFHEPMLIPDIFFLVSRRLAHHVLKHPEKTSLLRTLLEHERVIPRFRRTDIGSYHEALAAIRADAVQANSPDADAVAERLDESEGNGVKMTPAYWPPHSVGVEFATVVKSHLQAPLPPRLDETADINYGRLVDLWRQTQRWRHDSVNRALETAETLALENPYRGLRRGDIMNAVGRDLGFPEGYHVDHISELYPMVSNQRDRRALQNSWRWMNECCYLNQAKQLGAVPSFPSYDPLRGLVATSVLPPDAPVGPRIGDPPSVPPIRETVRFPMVDVLQRMSFEDLAKIRKDDGEGYRMALARWYRQPTEIHRQAAIDRLHGNANEIVKAARRQGEAHGLREVVAGAHAQPGRPVLVAAFYLACAAAAEQDSSLWPLAIVTPVVYEVYRLGVRYRTENFPVEILHPGQRTVPVEVNVPGA